MKRDRSSLVALLLITLIVSGLGITIAFIYTQGSTPSGPGYYNPNDSSDLNRSRVSSSLYEGLSFDVAKSDGYLDGYNLFNLHEIDANKRSERIHNSLVIFDMDGNL
ncbi:MAG: hypothetical protein ACXACD_14160, partial [Candidatus Thorarchaeota archaeon]